MALLAFETASEQIVLYTRVSNDQKLLGACQSGQRRAA
jgi:hypothetical protein